ncbi:MAG: FecR domain-containing protein, partial [Candidatus Omnitrophota bacterium]
NAMSLLGMGDSMRVLYKRKKTTDRRRQTSDGGQQTAAKAVADVSSLKSEVSPAEPAMKQALSKILEKVTAEPEAAPAPEQRVLKSATPIVMRQSEDGTRYGTLKNPGKEVFVRSLGGEWKSAKDGMVILPGDEVKTAERNSVEVLMDGGKVGRVEIKEGSLFRIQKAESDSSTGAKTTILDLAIGKILVKVEALKGNSKFEVRTPTALTGVRGTLFEVTVKEKA